MHKKRNGGEMSWIWSSRASLLISFVLAATLVDKVVSEWVFKAQIDKELLVIMQISESTYSLRVCLGFYEPGEEKRLPVPPQAEQKKQTRKQTKPEISLG